MKRFIDEITDFLKKNAAAFLYIAMAVTAILIAMLIAGIHLNVNYPKYYSLSVILLTISAPGIIFSSLIWIFYWALTHESAEQKLEKFNSYVSPVEIIPAPKVPKTRFNFKEDVIQKAFGAIAKKYKYRIKIDVQNYEILPFGSDCSPKKGYRIILIDDKNPFTIYIRPECIEFCIGFSSDDEFYFLFADDFARTNYLGFAENTYISEIEFANLSDNEIFEIIENMINVLYGATDIKVKKTESMLYRKHYQAFDYTFHVDEPDYYGYTETVTIGNFKFIINGGLLNG